MLEFGIEHNALNGYSFTGIGPKTERYPNDFGGVYEGFGRTALDIERLIGLIPAGG
jgi:hypothetical protein